MTMQTPTLYSIWTELFEIKWNNLTVCKKKKKKKKKREKKNPKKNEFSLV